MFFYKISIIDLLKPSLLANSVVLQEIDLDIHLNKITKGGETPVERYHNHNHNAYKTVL